MGKPTIFHGGYTILNEFEDSMFSPELIRKAAAWRRYILGWRQGYCVSLKFESSTFPGQVALEEESRWMLWIAIFKSAAPHVNEKDWNKGVTGYSPTTTFLWRNWETGKICSLPRLLVRWICC